MPVLLGLRRGGGGGGGGGAYRHYRLLVTVSEGGNDWVSVNELVLYGAPAGGTASASSSYSGNLPANAFDGNDASHWESGESLPEWLAIDLGAPTVLTGYGIKARNTSGTSRTAPTTFEFQGSHDGATWVTLDAQAGLPTWSALEQRDFVLSAPAQPTQLIIPLASAADDWFTYNPHGAANFNSIDGSAGNRDDRFYLGRDARVGLRFALDVPKGATINSAKLRLLAYNSRAAVGAIRVRAVAADDASAASDGSAAAALYANPGSASAAWTLGETTADQLFDSDDLSPVIQELVTRAGWASGNHGVLLLDSSESHGTHAQVFSYETLNNGSGVPELHLEYQ